MKYLAVLSFEKMMLYTGRKFDYFKGRRDLEVPEVIRFLRENKDIEREEERRLSIWHYFRNDVMHGTADMAKAEINKKTTSLLRFICERLILDFEQKLEFEDISLFGEREPQQIRRFEKIVDSDFDNFMDLYDKCPALQREVGKNLNVSLLPEQITEFTPDTGSIWVPYVTHKIPDKRAHMYRASLGIVFTPTTIRIGLDFGGKAYEPKERYLELLLEGKLESELKYLQSCDGAYSFCDTFWYYHIRNVRPLEWYFQVGMQEKKEIEDSLEEARQARGKSMTANRFLIGKVIQRESEEFPNVLENLSDQASRAIDEIYRVVAKIEARATQK